jgi:hypothetical protein
MDNRQKMIIARLSIGIVQAAKEKASQEILAAQQLDPHINFADYNRIWGKLSRVIDYLQGTYVKR